MTSQEKIRAAALKVLARIRFTLESTGDLMAERAGEGKAAPVAAKKRRLRSG